MTRDKKYSLMHKLFKNISPRFSIARYFVFSSIIIVLTVSLISFSILMYLVYSQQTRRLHTIQKESARAMAAEIESYLDDFIQKLNYISRIKGLTAINAEHLENIFNALIRHNDAYEFIALYDSTGNIVKFAKNSIFTEDLSNKKDAFFFRYAFDYHEEYIGEIIFDEKTNISYLSVAMPVRDKNDNINGVLYAKINLKFLWFILSKNQIEQNGYFYLLDNNEKLIISTLNLISLPKLNKIVENILTEKADKYIGEFTDEYDGLLGKKVIGATANIASLNLNLFAEIPVKEAYRGFYKILVFSIFITLSILIIIILLVYKIALNIVNPLNKLTAATEDIAVGNLDIIIELDSENELGLLANAFNQMVTRIKFLITDLQKKNNDIKTSEKKANALNNQLMANEAQLKAMNQQLRASEQQLKAANQQLRATEQQLRASNIQLSNDKQQLRNLNEKLIISEQKYKGIIENSPFPIALIDSNDNILFVNNSIISKFGYTTKDISNISEWIDNALISTEHKTEFRNEWDKLTTINNIEKYPEQSVSNALTIKCKNNDIKNVIAHLVCIQGKQKFVIFEDLTEQQRFSEKLKLLNRELMNANDELKTLDQMKTNILSNVSHELRTPLVSIRGYVEMILSKMSGPLTEKQNKQLNICLKSVTRLTNLIDDLLNFSKLTRGKEALNYSTFTLQNTINETIEILNIKLKTKNINILTNFPEFKIKITADRDKLMRVFINIIDNAIKFSEMRSNIIIDLIKNTDETITIKIQDFGIGIPKDKTEKIFDRFYQIDASSTRKYNGIGIGLPICKNIIELHNGNIVVESEPSKGSIFTINLPVTPLSAEKKNDITETANLKNINNIYSNRILVIDDDKDVLEYYATLFDTENLTYYLADRGSKALEILNTKNVDIILLDVAMDEINGIDLCKLIKENPLTAHIPIIIVSARIEESVKKSAFNAGANSFISKPFRMEILINKIIELTNK